MTDLSESIRTAVSRTRTERELPANVLAAIEGAGFVVIEAERWERVQHVAAESSRARAIYLRWKQDPFPMVPFVERALVALRPGDLDPSAEG